MTKIRDVLVRDPTTWSIPNEGVTQIGPPRSPEEWNVLRYELQAFVAEGAYEGGLETILASYLTHLERDSQPAAWVSGFFGSGKSHLLRVLDSLWMDLEFPDGTRASALVNLPDDLTDQLAELKRRAAQSGGRFSAAGTLNAGGTSAALSILSIVFAAAGLPENLAAARLVLWLQREGLLDPVQKHLVAAGKTLEQSLRDMYVSEHLAGAILAARPTFAPTNAEVRAEIRAQFPSGEELPDEEFFSILDETLRTRSKDGGIPLTLLVLDELQQFLANDPVRTLEVQQLVEMCCKRFGSRLLFAASGQMALSATPSLQKLQDRFRVEVTLRDTDVDRVVRSVVLRKQPERIAELAKSLDGVAGEISRHLQGSNIAANAADAADLIPDYPLLPTRRRFWDAVLRAMDTAGRSQKLRTQLRIVLDAIKGVADRDLGVVVPAHAIYSQLSDEFLASGALPRETAKLIDDLDDGTPEGLMRCRVARVVFLIGKLPREGASPTGVRATPDVIADLLVEDLRSDGPPVRAAVPAAAAVLVQRGVLMEVAGEYVLQTPTSAEWAADFEMYRRELQADEAWLASARQGELRTALDTALKGVQPVQGDSRQSRRFRVYYGEDEPRGPEDEIALWIRDGWNTSEKPVVERARQAGVTNSTVFGFLEKTQGDDVRSALIEAEAASRTIDRRPPPTTPEGIEARAGLASRRDVARARIRSLAEHVVSSGRIFQGGGAEIQHPPANPTFAQSAARALESAALRLYPEFGIADSKAWSKVVDLAREGNPTPLKGVGHNGEVDAHPVVKTILASLPAVGRKGNEVRKLYSAPPYGWSQDAIDGSLLALMAGGRVEARYNGEIVGPKQIAQNQLGVVEFRSQVIVITMPQRIDVRNLALSLGAKLQGVDDLELPRLIAARLHELADAAGADAPMPARPSVERVRDLEALSGNEQFVAFADAKTELELLITQWQALAAKIPQRKKQWEQTRELLRHAADLADAADLTSQLEAVAGSRMALDDPDPVTPILSRLAEVLRAAATERWASYAAARSAVLRELEGSDDWEKVDASTRGQILVEVGLGTNKEPPIGSTEELLSSLDSVPLADWGFRTQAVEPQAAQALARAVQLLTPDSVELPRARTVIHSDAELETYLDEVRNQVHRHLADGKTVII